LNILFDLLKTFNVSFNILKSTRPLHPFNTKQYKYFIIKYHILKKNSVFQIYLAYLFHNNILKGKILKIIEGETGYEKDNANNTFNGFRNFGNNIF